MPHNCVVNSPMHCSKAATAQDMVVNNHIISGGPVGCLHPEDTQEFLIEG